MGIQEDLDEINFLERVDTIMEHQKKAKEGSEGLTKRVKEVKEVHQRANKYLEKAKLQLFERGKYDEVYRILGQLVENDRETRSIISGMMIFLVEWQDSALHRRYAQVEFNSLLLSLFGLLAKKIPGDKDQKEIEKIKSKMSELENDVKPLQEEGVRWVLDELQQSLSEIAHTDIDVDGEENE